MDLRKEIMIDSIVTVIVLFGYFIHPILGWLALGVAFFLSTSSIIMNRNTDEFWEMLYLISWKGYEKQRTLKFIVTQTAHWLALVLYVFIDIYFAIGLLGLIYVHAYYFYKFKSFDNKFNKNKNVTNTERR